MGPASGIVPATMSTAERMREVRALKKRGEWVPQQRAPHLPWPRADSDGTPLGVDLRAHAGEVRDVVRKYFRPPAGVEIDDYVQEVFLRVARRNHMPSAHDPRKSSLKHYIYMVANATGADMANEMARRAAERPQGPAGAVGPGTSVDEIRSPVGTGTEEFLREAEMSLDSLAASGAIGPTAKSYAMDCLAGMPTTSYGPVWRRGELRAEIEEAVSEPVPGVRLR